MISPFGRRFRRVPFIPQLEIVECGAASLAMVMAYYGHEVDLQELREACAVSRDGANAYDILAAAQSYGFATDAVRATVDDLAVLPLPAILHWKRKHFLVLERVDEERAWLIDPAIGPLTLPLQQVASLFSGVALLVTPTPVVRKRRRRASLLPRTLLRPIAPNLLHVGLISLVLQPLAMTLPVLTQVVIDRIAAAHDMQLVVMIAVSLCATVARAFLSFVQSYVLQNVQAVSDTRMMGTFVRHLLSLPLKFFLARRSGDLLFRLQSNSMVRELLAGTIVSTAFGLFLIAGYMVLLLLYDVRAALLIAGFSLLRMAAIQMARVRNRRLIHSELSAMAAESETFAEGFAAFETVRATRSEERVVEQWTRRVVERWNWTAKRRLVDIDAESLMTLVEGLALAALVVYAGLQVTSGAITVGSFAVLLMLQTLIRQPLDSLLVAAQQWQVEQQGGRRAELAGGLALENVSFRYAPRGPWTVRDVSLRVQPGEKVAIVGRSGQGKSTLGRLLLGLYEPEQGNVRFDGADLRELDHGHVRRQIGVVAQEPFLFNDTVAYNITLGDPAVDDAGMREAARIACLDDVIGRMPAGYDSIIGENGSRLSGGERQRLAIARALAHRPRILLLDEATSALDVATERRLHQNLAALACTRIVIAHRPQAIADAARVITVEGCGIVADERRELAEPGGVYA
jgi:ABC-type bacteriocin/lantibiotic exporter with double-glycine peptidase domain